MFYVVHGVFTPKQWLCLWWFNQQKWWYKETSGEFSHCESCHNWSASPCALGRRHQHGQLRHRWLKLAEVGCFLGTFSETLETAFHSAVENMWNRLYIAILYPIGSMYDICIYIYANIKGVNIDGIHGTPYVTIYRITMDPMGVYNSKNLPSGL